MNKYKLMIKLKRLDYLSEHKGIIFFNENKNYFIYNFRFGNSSFYSAPIEIDFTNFEQLQIYIKFIDNLNIINKENLISDLFDDSKQFLINKNSYYFDFYLELFKLCYNKKEIKDILIIFDLNKVELPVKFHDNNYTKFLFLIEEKKDVIIKYCEKNDNIEKYYIKFYSILLYFLKNYEKEKFSSFLYRKDLWKYYVDILPFNYKYFSEIDIPETFINEIFTKYNMSYEKIKGIFFYIKSIKIILNFVNKYKEAIFMCLIKEKKKIEMSNYLNQNSISDINDILNKLEQLINYELEKNQFTIIFDENFWKKYIYNAKSDFKKLDLIKEGIILCQKIDNNLIFDYNIIIHETALNMIKEGQLKNIKLLNFIEDDIYFKNDKFKSELYRPFLVFENGIDLENINNEFFEKWNKIGILNIYSFDEISVCKIIINKIKKIKDFWKILKLYNIKEFENNNNFSINLLELISNKYKSLLNTYKSEECKNFINESSLIIYLIDKYNMNVNNYMKNIFEKKIQCHIVNDIYLFLSLNYNDISKTVIEAISDYLVSDYNISKIKNIINIINQLHSEDILFLFFNKLNNLFIKEEEIFEESKEIDSFIFLENIQKEDMLKKYISLNKTKYIIDTINFRNFFLNNIKNGNLKYKYFYSWKKKEKKEIIKEKLSILFFKDNKIIEEYINIFNKYLESIETIFLLTKKLTEVLKKFYDLEYQKNIEMINELELKIKNGMLNEIDKKDTQEIIDKLYRIFPDLDKKYELSKSELFSKLFNLKKKNKEDNNEEYIFKEAQNDFEKLELLFKRNENWTIKLDECIINEIISLVKEINQNELIEELKLLKNYFKLNDINEPYIQKILDEFKIYIKKEELYKIINGNFSLLLDIQNKNKEESTFFNYYKNNLLNIKNILKSKKEIGLNNKEFEEKNNCKSDINIQLNKLKDDLNKEKNKNKNYEQNMKDLNNERKKIIN